MSLALSTKLINEFKQKKINNIKKLYNYYLNIINKNYTSEIRFTSRNLIPFNQKRLMLQTIIGKYNKLRLSLKKDFDKEIQTILNSEVSGSTNIYNKKKALLFGLNYIGTSSQLNGCINDVKSIETVLKEKHFDEITILTDETLIKPTKTNILNELINFLQNSNTNDLLFIFYSGHGSYTLDRSGDELDGYDEVIVPLDFDFIIDDELKTIIDTYGKPDTNIISLFDCCNSGTSLDLKYQMLEKVNYDDITDNPRNLETPCNILYISGCRDEQLSLETFISNKVQGLMTWSFLEILKTNKDITWRNLLKQMRLLIKKKSYQSQIPQLSSGKLFNPDTKVFL
jgi:hypothetical protein